MEPSENRAWFNATARAFLPEITRKPLASTSSKNISRKWIKSILSSPIIRSANELCLRIPSTINVDWLHSRAPNKDVVLVYKYECMMIQMVVWEEKVCQTFQGQYLMYGMWQCSAIIVLGALAVFLQNCRPLILRIS